MAEEKDDLEALLSRAKGKEREYDWLCAAESYEKALDPVSMNDSLKRGEILERQGFSLYKAAMQSDGEGQFRERTQKAIDCYVKAESLYEETPEPMRTPFKTRTEAMVAFLGYWKSSIPTEKKALVKEAWRNAIEAMKGFEGITHAIEYIRTFNQLTLSAAVAHELADDFETQVAIVGSGLDAGEKAIKMISSRTEPSEIAKAHANTCAFLTAIRMHTDQTAVRSQYDKHAIAFWQRAVQSSEESALSELASTLVLTELPKLFKMDQSEELLGKAVEHGRATHDRLLIGMALGALAGRASWSTLAAGDSDESENLSRKALQFASEASKELSKISFLSPGSGWEMWIVAPEASVYGILAYGEIDAKKKREFAQKAVRAYPSALKLAQDSEYPYLTSCMQHRFGYSLTSLAKTETDKSTKKGLLEKAIELRKAAMTGTTVFEPYSFWSRGTDQSLLAEAEFELATVVDDPIEKRAMLHEAISRKKDSLDLHFKEISLTPPEAEENLLTDYPIVGHWLLQYSSWLELLYEMEGDRSSLAEARDALGKAAEMFTKREVPSRMAECRWKAAQVCDSLEEYKRGAESFLLASDGFKTAARKTSQLRAMFEEYSQYMRAWAAIENAKYCHSMDDPASASRKYEEAAQLLKATSAWCYLSDFFSGMANSEHAEDLSRKEMCQEAAELFELSAKSFTDAKTAIQSRIGEIESADEKKMVAGVLTDSDRRIAYCRARISLEEARLFEMRGELTASWERYSMAASSFHMMLDGLDSAQNRRPLELILSLTNAWQAMAKAESEASPETYGKAAEHFDKAKELAVSERMKLMATGNSHFCKALEAGARFADAADPAFHSTATRHLESAAKYYLKADLQNAAEYAKASKLLFDGYAYMDKASTEEDHGKKVKLYAMAEKVLQLSAASYAKAAQPRKRDQVSKLLRKVVEDRELAVALTEVFLAPDVTSTTMAFSSPTPTHEAAAGLDRFEHADVQATLIVKPKELLVDQDLSLEIELVNVGNGVAQLTKVDKLIPEGFDVAAEPEKYRIEDSYLNMKGRRLGAMKTEDVKLLLKPKSKGRFAVKPRVMYLDESGKYKTYELEPVVVTVKELGISGWLKGSDRRK